MRNVPRNHRLSKTPIETREDNYCSKSSTTYTSNMRIRHPRAVTVRVPSPLAEQCRKLAHTLGWRLAPLIRMLICLGACILFLTAGNADGEEAASNLLGGVRLVRFTRALTLSPGRRRYAFRMSGRRSELFTLSLPESFCDLVSIYADFAHATCNQAYYRFLQQGLITYAKAQASLLEATAKPQAATNERLKAEVNEITNGTGDINPHRETQGRRLPYGN